LQAAANDSVSQPIYGYSGFSLVFPLTYEMDFRALAGILKPSLPCDPFTLSREARKTIREINFLATPIGQAF